jgi:hypothetical protein
MEIVNIVLGISSSAIVFGIWSVAVHEYRAKKQLLEEANDIIKTHAETEVRKSVPEQHFETAGVTEEKPVHL